jgi:peptidoglycan/LPS O-acetylase OafA/YrhL
LCRSTYSATVPTAFLLFFIISGYCIAGSASTSQSAWHFYAKRLGRLLPALVVCSFISTAAKQACPHLIEASRIPWWFDMAYTWIALPTLNILKVSYIRPDGAYWSLNVEFQFYLLYFSIMLVGLRKYVLEIVCGWVAVAGLIAQPGELRSLDFFPFFVAGLSVAAFFSRAG